MLYFRKLTKRLRSIKTVFLCELFYLWLVLPNKKVTSWLSSVLQPVLEHFIRFCIKDSLSFSKIIIRNFIPTDVFMCSFDVCSLYTSIPLEETIEICCDVLFCSSLLKSTFTESVFKHLMNFATSSIEFSFNNIMYRPIDGVAMGASLSPTLANILVGFCEANLFTKIDCPLMYYRYVDDTFCLFKNENDADSFLIQLNSMHPSLKFTMEKESNHQLAFLDVFVHKTSTVFLTSVYRKPIFSGLYTRWESLCPQQRKINLIKTLVHRALMISSRCFLDDEIRFIRLALSRNGCPLSVLDSVVHGRKNDALNGFDRAERCTVGKYPVCLRLPYMGSGGEKFVRCIAAAVGRCCFSAAVRVAFLTRAAFISMRRDVLPPYHISSLIYKYTCGCGGDYIGGTSNRLDLRIKQRLSARILNLELKRGQLVNTSGSSIADHMINNRECVADFNVDRFSILSRSHSLYHLKVLETLYVRSLQPSLCKQRDCLLGSNVIGL